MTKNTVKRRISFFCCPRNPILSDGKLEVLKAFYPYDSISFFVCLFCSLFNCPGSIKALDFSECQSNLIHCQQGEFIPAS